MSDSWEVLDGYVVDAATERAILIKKIRTGATTWVPRSVCECGDELGLHDRDIVVRAWFVRKEGLDT